MRRRANFDTPITPIRYRSRSRDNIDPVVPMGTAAEVHSLLSGGHEHLARGNWQNARASFEKACALGETAEALEGLGMAAWWLDDAETVFDARERAYQSYQQRGDRRGAARVAITLALDSFQFRGQLAVAKGWHRRAGTLLTGLPPSAEQAWLRLCECELSLGTAEDPAHARGLAADAAAIARAIGDSDVETVALSMEGLALVMQGALDDGMPRLDEAAATALSGELGDPMAVMICCCHLLSACELVRDFGRASEWCDRVREYAARFNYEVLLSVCRASHAEVLMWGGAWSEAEAELTRCAQQLASARPAQQEHVLVRLAELRRRQGRFDEAEAVLERVEWHPHGRLVRAGIALDRGDANAAVESALRFLEQMPPSNKTDRALAGEVLIRAELLLGRTPRPELLAELRELAANLGTDPLQASARAAEGVVLAASGQHERARTAFDEAISLFARSGASYEPARVRVDLARSLIALNQTAAARDELQRACRIFEQIGAAWDAQHARVLLDKAMAGDEASPAAGKTAGALSPRELEVLRLLAQGLSNSMIAKQLGVSEFTVKRHVGNILTKLDLPTRAAAAAHAARTGLA
jgi:LuxR family transcriptional regulator, maltose regulon positive regulatory protein